MTSWLTRLTPYALACDPGKGHLTLGLGTRSSRKRRRLWLLVLVAVSIKVSGGCYGTDQDVIDSKVRAIQPRIDHDGIVALAIVNAHAAMCLLGDCAEKALAMDYYLRITQPALSAPAAEAFWAAIPGPQSVLRAH